jgi:hypothetical protein
MIDDPLRRRLAAADPAPPGKVPGLPADRLEALMSRAQELTPQEGPARPAHAARRPQRRWAVAVAAAAAAVVVTAVGIAALQPDAPEETAADPGLVLTLPGASEAALASCIALSPEALAVFPVAFSGVATAVTDDTVIIDVDRWYRGGDAGTVALETPPGEHLVALVGAVEFTEGERYLVTAEGGRVSVCGFTAPWSEELAGMFAEAFGG